MKNFILETTSKHLKHTIAFYNLENLFDIYNDPKTNDNDFLPTNTKKWTTKRYTNKLRKLGFAISNIGLKETISDDDKGKRHKKCRSIVNG